MSDVDLPTWRFALDSRSTPAAARRLGLIGDSGLDHRLLSVRTTADGTETDCWFGGDRVGVSAGLQRLMIDAAGSDKKWLIQWIHGRWPRGVTCFALPLDRDDGTLALGIAAPLSPTRVALSEGPLPFPIPSVMDFKALHAASAGPGMLGCRLHLEHGEVVRVVCRWPVATTSLVAFADIRGLADVAADYAIPAVEGLASGLSSVPNLVVEAAWTPDPLPQIVVELGPVSAVGVAGLTKAAIGDRQAHGLIDLARAFGTKGLFRARLTFDNEGLAGIEALAGPKGQARRVRW